MAKLELSPSTLAFPILFLALTGILLAMSPAGAASPPPPRVRAEIEAILARSPGPAPQGRQQELKVLVLANPKDHGLEEHDYPLWQKRWTVLLGGKGAGDARQVNLYGPPPGEAPEETLAGAPGVKVSTAWVWPAKTELESADLIVAFTGTGGWWNRERIEDLERFLERGGGFVAVHSAVITSREFSKPLASLIGLAWEDGFTTFRHGPVELRIAAPDHPICLGLPSTIRFEDESYWPLVGDKEKVDLLATADEVVKTAAGGSAPAPQSMFWTFQRGKGRVFSCILGHYTWTFDDPFFRILLLRGMAWAARESPYRFDPLVLRGARVREKAEALAPRSKSKVPPRPPDPKDPRLLLWLDASDRSTMTVDPDGGVSDWSCKAAGGGRGLSSWGSQRPSLVPDGPGGRPAVRFDGKDDVLRDTGFRRSVTDWTLFVVATVRSNAGNFRALFTANATGKNDFISGINLDLGGLPSESLDTLNLEGIQHVGQSNLKTTLAPFGTFLIALSRGKGLARAFVNGAEEGERYSEEVPASFEEIRIGARIYQNPAGRLPLVESGFLDGDISEVALYGEEIGAEEREGIQAYLEEKYGVALTVIQEPTLEEAFEKLPKFEIGKGRRALGPIDDAISASHGDPQAREDLEARLLAVLRSDATRDAKDFVCRRLAIAGSLSSVPALAALLEDGSLSYPARCALEGISGPEAAAALREALPKVKGKTKAGVIDSLGRIGDQGAIPSIAALLADGDPEIAAAAASALGRMGAAGPLRSFLEKASGPRAGAAAQALLDLAYRLVLAEKKEEAAGILKQLAALEGGSPGLRATAARILKEMDAPAGGAKGAAGAPQGR